MSKLHNICRPGKCNLWEMFALECGLSFKATQKGYCRGPQARTKVREETITLCAYLIPTPPQNWPWLWQKRRKYLVLLAWSDLSQSSSRFYKKKKNLINTALVLRTHWEIRYRTLTEGRSIIYLQQNYRFLLWISSQPQIILREVETNGLKDCILFYLVSFLDSSFPLVVM